MTHWKEVLGWGEEQCEELRVTGYAYLRQGKYDIAKTLFEALVILEPDNAYHIQTLGALYLQLGDAKKAAKILEKSLKIEGEHAPALLNLAKSLFLLGKKEEALKIAHMLKRESSRLLSNMAKALILAYS